MNINMLVSIYIYIYLHICELAYVFILYDHNPCLVSNGNLF